MRSLITGRRGSRARPAFLALVSLAAALLAACGSTGEVATVDGEPITFDEVAALIPDEGDTVDVSRFANSLMLVVADRVMSSQAEEHFGVVRTEQQVDGKLGELLLQTGLSAEQIYETYGLTETSLRLIAAQEVTAEQVAAELLAGAEPATEEELMAIYEASLRDLSEVCAAHILVETEEEGNATYDRAIAGEDFAALAMELSTGPSGPNGGDLGCSSPATYVEEFAAATLEAEVGVPFGPVQTSFGWHVILVNERTAPAFEDVRDRLAEDLQLSDGNRRWVEWLTRVLVEAEVTVEPEYGTWTTEPSPNIIPPES
ncbi:MAG: peptidylprolyl isomerase [Acidimicrobiia bacterium]|nr:peptidylprolyl isomerase [Acidimicrobiia bacterium]